MDFLSQSLKNLTPDTFISILMTMPGSTVIALCATNKEFNNFCKSYSERIFLQLSVRDYEPYLGDRGTNSWKQFYLKKNATLGQPYILNFNYDSKDICKTTIGDTAKIISRDYWQNPNSKIKFNLGPFLGPGYNQRKVIASDFERGKKYWIIVAVSGETRYNAQIFEDFDSAFQRALIFIEVIPNLTDRLDQIFPHDSEWFYPQFLRMSFKTFFLKNERLCYIPRKGVTNMLIIKEIYLE